MHLVSLKDWDLCLSPDTDLKNSQKYVSSLLLSNLVNVSQTSLRTDESLDKDIRVYRAGYSNICFQTCRETLPSASTWSLLFLPADMLVLTPSFQARLPLISEEKTMFSVKTNRPTPYNAAVRRWRSCWNVSPSSSSLTLLSIHQFCFSSPENATRSIMNQWTTRFFNLMIMVESETNIPTRPHENTSVSPDC